MDTLTGASIQPCADSLQGVQQKKQLNSRDNTVLEAIRSLPNISDFTYDNVIARKTGNRSVVYGGYSLTSIKYAISSLVDEKIVKEIGRRNRVLRFALS